MSRPDIVQMSSLYEPTNKALDEKYTVHRYWAESDKDGLLARVAPNCRVVVTSGGRGVEGARQRIAQLAGGAP